RRAARSWCPGWRARSAGCAPRRRSRGARRSRPPRSPAVPGCRRSPRRRTSARGGLVGQQVERAHRVHSPALVDQSVNGVLDDREKRAELLFLAAEVVGGQQPEGDDLDAGLLAPLEELEDLVGALAVPLADVGVPGGPGPAPVAVAHHADVPGYRLSRQVALQPALVQPVAQVAVSHEPTFLAAERA